MLSVEELADLFLFARRVTAYLSHALHSEEFNWALQHGRAAGQTVPHVHIHILIRHQEDLGEDLWLAELQRGRANRRQLASDERDTLVNVLRSYSNGSSAAE